MKLPRFYQNLDKFIEPNRVLVIYGPQRVGKTTLIENYLKKTKFKYLFDIGDNIATQRVLSSQDFKQIKNYVGNYQLLVLDEAQNIPNIGIGLKIIVDQIPNIRVIATGSASFELSGQIGEPLTGRKTTLKLYPLSLVELKEINTPFRLDQKIADLLILGSYPKVLTQTNREDQIKILEEIFNSYLLKDILVLEKVKSAKVLHDLLRLLAFQIGSEVSLNELGRQLGLDVKTVSRYLDLLEKSFIIYNLRGFSRNLRKEIVKKSKYYFLDNGIRNAAISNFNALDLRNDKGQLWENFLVSERLKRQAYIGPRANNFFWRTWDKKEIDWLEEREGKLFGFELKWQGKIKISTQKEFTQAYKNSQLKTITRKDYLNFLT